MWRKERQQEIFEFLHSKVAAFDYTGSKKVFVARGQGVLTNRINLEMSSCDHKDADLASLSIVDTVN